MAQESTFHCDRGIAVRSSIGADAFAFGVEAHFLQRLVLGFAGESL